MKRRNLILILCLFLGFTTFAQNRVTGVVNDSQNVPVPGVTVLEKGTSNGVITDFDGNYTIDVAGADAVLVFSFVGMESQEVLVGNQSNISLQMRDFFSDLDEVIVVGYGVQRKRLTTGATVQVGGEDLERLSTVSPMTALQGQTPGVSIIKNSGEPGSGFKVNIRGVGTVGNSAPLYVIDGVPGGNIDYLAPSDIESIDVLKDAASAAIYGSRAANGVILVTTKRGTRDGRVNVTYDGYYGVQNLYKKLPLANALEYSILTDEARLNSGQPLFDYASLVPNWSEIEAGTWKGTDWLDKMTVENASIQNHAVNIFGGTERQSYSLGLSYTNQEGIFGAHVNSNYERYTFRLNSDYSILRDRDDRFDVIRVGETLRFAHSDRTGIGTGNQYWNDVFSVTTASPFLPMYDNEGNYHDVIAWDTQAPNPIGMMEYNRGLNQSKGYNLDGSLYLELQPVERLIYRSSFGYRFSANSYRSYSPEYDFGSAATRRTYDQISHNLSAGHNWTFENTLRYAFNINTDHSFDALVGMSAEKWGMGEFIEGRNRNSLIKGFEYAYLDNTPVIDSEGGTALGSNPWGDGGLLSYFGRFNYDFRERYMATLIMRADGSSNFAKNNRWGYFPSVSAGWIITEENFMEGARGFMDFLKFRASWGQNGNASIRPFQYLSTISYENVNYFFGPDKGRVSVGGYPDILPNPDVTWETSEQLNIGLDARFLRSRLGLALDWYQKTTKDWLVRADGLASFGAQAAYINGGDIENTGIEVALTWNDRIGEFRYGLGFNLAYNENEVTFIDNAEGIIYGPSDVLGQGTTELYRAQVGYPIGYFRGYKTVGVFQNQPQIDNYVNSAGQRIMPNAQPGDLIFADTNDDGQITDADKVMIGDPNPDMIIGFNINTEYRGFDFSLQANGALGFQIARSWRRWNDSPRNNFTTDVFNRWHGEGTSNHYPRLTYGAHPNWQYVSDIFVEDGDYVRISNVTLGYDFKRLFPEMALGQARLYVSAQNLYTFTNYSGMDPEIGTSTDDDSYGWAKGIDIGFYPSPRTYLVGVSLKF